MRDFLFGASVVLAVVFTIAGISVGLTAMDMRVPRWMTTLLFLAYGLFVAVFVGVATWAR